MSPGLVTCSFLGTSSSDAPAGWLAAGSLSAGVESSSGGAGSAEGCGVGVGAGMGVSTGSGCVGELWPMSGVTANIIVATIATTRRLEQRQPVTILIEQFPCRYISSSRLIERTVGWAVGWA